METRNSILLIICGLAIGFVLGYGVYQYKDKKVYGESLNPPGISDTIPAVKKSPPQIKTYKNPCEVPLDGKKFKLVYNQHTKLYACQMWEDAWDRWEFITGVDDTYVTTITIAYSYNTFSDSCTAKKQAQRIINFWKQQKQSQEYSAKFK